MLSVISSLIASSSDDSKHMVEWCHRIDDKHPQTSNPVLSGFVSKEFL